MTLSEVAIRRPVFTTMTSLAIIVLGVMGLTRLGVDLFPDVSFPVVSVTTIYPGASPSVAEEQISKPLEEALVSLNGIDHMYTYSRDSVSQVVIMFKLDVDLQEAATQVRERVTQVRPKLPDGIKEPSVSRMDVGADPIMTYTLSGNADIQTLRDIGEDFIRPSLEQVDGVAQVRVGGGRERQINVMLDFEKMQSHSLTAAMVADRIRMENLSIPAGDFREGDRKISVRTQGELRSVQDLSALAVSTGRDGSLVRLSDIAEVTDGLTDNDLVVRSGAAPAVVLDILKASGRNTVEVASKVQERIAKLDIPEGVSLNLIVDQASFVLENTHEVEVALIFGGAMAILVILLFMLDLRSTFISGLALPTSVIGAFFLMYALGYTLNMMTLLGLSLAIGLLIDDSIVVRENIMKHLERGETPIDAAINGTKEITLAVLATTATLCAVFVPVAFTAGIVGQFFKQFGITVAGATVLSAWVALTLDPMLSARLAKMHKPGEVGRFDFLKRPFLYVFAQMDAVYLSVLKWIVNRRRNLVFTGLMATVVFMGSCSLMPMIGSEFVAVEDRGQFIVYGNMPGGTSLEETSRRTLLAEAELQKDKRFVTVYSRSGINGATNAFRWRVVTLPKWERKENLFEMQDLVRQAIKKHMPEASTFIGIPPMVEGGWAVPIIFNMTGDNLDDLERASQQIKSVLRTVPGTKDVHIDYTPGKPELEMQINRDRAAQLGVPAFLLGRTLRASIEGEVAGVMRRDGKEDDIRVRLREQDRDQADLVARMRVPTPMGFIPVTDVGSLVRGETPSMIQRLDRRRVIAVWASIEGRPLGEIVEETFAKLDKEKLPAGVTYTIDGDAKMMFESNNSMGIALLLGIVFIYLVLASQFESFLHPITIMMALPMAVVGALLGLFFYGSAMNLAATIGLILLMGLVTKNGILLVDHAVVRVREGWRPVDAILDAGPARLRPILMTSAAMVLGMLPTAMSNGSGSEFRGPMAVAVIGGVISSTLLTLLVVPVFYLFIEWIRGLGKKKSSSSELADDLDAPQHAE